MENATYTTLTRQSGLMREMQAVAHNIANLSTTGFRKEGVIFSEHVVALETATSSLSMAAGHARHTSPVQGGVTHTGGRFDFAIEGEGYFLLETADGERLTRAGSFTPNEAGELVTAAGDRVLDEGGAPIFVPPDAGAVALARDGTLSADDIPLARIAIVQPLEPEHMRREAGVLFRADGPLAPVAQPSLVQGSLEESNVAPVTEMARMIEVQRAYELGQSFLEREDDRIRTVIETLGR